MLLSHDLLLADLRAAVSWWVWTCHLLKIPMAIQGLATPTQSPLTHARNGSGQTSLEGLERNSRLGLLSRRHQLSVHSHLPLLEIIRTAQKCGPCVSPQELKHTRTGGGGTCYWMMPL